MCPAWPLPTASFTWICRISFHASLRTASSCPASAGASIETKEYVLSLQSSPRGPSGTESIPAGKRETAEVQRDQGPHWKPSSSRGRGGAWAHTSPLTAPNTHSFLPFPHHGAGGLPEGRALLLLLLGCELGNRQGQDIEAEVPPRQRKLVSEHRTARKKGPHMEALAQRLLLTRKRE